MTFEEQLNSFPIEHSESIDYNLCASEITVTVLVYQQVPFTDIYICSRIKQNHS